MFKSLYNFLTALGCHCLSVDAPDAVSNIAETLGMSNASAENIATGLSGIAGSIFTDKFKESISNEKDLQDALEVAYQKTFDALAIELLQDYGKKEKTTEILKRIISNKVSKSYEEAESLKLDFIAPLERAFKDETAIEQAIANNKLADMDTYLDQIIKATLPEYAKEDGSNTADFAVDMRDRFKRIFRVHFLKELSNSNNAKTAYFTGLLEANLNSNNRNEALSKNIYVELGVATTELKEAFVKQQQETIKAIENAIANLSEPILIDNDWSDETEEANKFFHFNYKYQVTKFTGRNKEKSMLLNFAMPDSDSKKFRWWMITGAGGMGKSRLAFEVAKTLKKHGYHAGYYDIKNENQFDWSRYNATHPAFIIIDYALADARKVSTIIETLFKRKNDLKNNVRLLLIDRQKSNEWDNTIMKIQEVFNAGYKGKDGNTYYELPPLADALWTIMTQVITDADITDDKKRQLLAQKDNILDNLKKLDNKERPLFAFLSATALVDGKNIKDWNVHQLLKYQINWLKEKRWSKIDGYNEAADEIAMLLAVNTLVKELNHEELNTVLDKLKIKEDKEQRKKLLNSVYKYITTHKQNKTGYVYDGMEPDILGEFFVIDCFTQLAKEPDNKEKADEILQLCWQLKPEECLETAYMIWQDFYINNKESEDYYPLEQQLKKQILHEQDKAKAALANYYARKGYYLGTVVVDHDSAGCAYTEAINIAPDDAVYYYNRGTAYSESGKYEIAIKDFDKAIELNQEYADAYNNRGIAYRDIKDYTQAIKDYDKAIELNQEYADAYNNRGNAYGEIKDYTQAIKDFDKAIELNPLNASTYYNRGNTYYDIKDYTQAIKDFDKAIELNPEDATAYNNRGIAYHATNNNEQAIKDYDKAIKLSPEDASAYYNRGNTYYDIKDYTQAIKDFDKAIELNPKYASAYNNRGIMYAMQGEYALAISDITHHTKITDKGYYLLAYVHVLADRKEAAFENLAQALKNKEVHFTTVAEDELWAQLRDEPQYKTLKQQYD